MLIARYASKKELQAQVGQPLNYEETSFFGPEYAGISAAFWPYWSDAGDNPFVVFANHDEKPGVLVVEPHDFGWKGGPPMPARFQPWLDGSPYARCDTR